MKLAPDSVVAYTKGRRGKSATNRSTAYAKVEGGATPPTTRMWKDVVGKESDTSKRDISIADTKDRKFGQGISLKQGEGSQTLSAEPEEVRGLFQAAAKKYIQKLKKDGASKEEIKKFEADLESNVSKYVRAQSLKISPTGQIIIDKVFVKNSNCLEYTQGWSSVFSCLNKARYGISWGVLGSATECWLIAKDYVENRIMFKKPLAANQLIQKKLADMQTEINLGLSSCLLTANAMNNDKNIINAISILKRNNCKKSLDIVRDCRDMLGANGLVDEYHIMRHLVNLETVKTYEGAENIHSLILGKNQTGIASF